jgi:hypothetical protein
MHLQGIKALGWHALETHFIKCLTHEGVIYTQKYVGGFNSDNITQPNTLKCGASLMRLRCGSWGGGSDASFGGFGWVGAKIAPYFFDWVGPYFIS